MIGYKAWKAIKEKYPDTYIPEAQDFFRFENLKKL